MEIGFYPEIVKESTDIATVIDFEGTITYVSPSVRGMLGYEPEGLIGEVGFECQHPDDREAVADAIGAGSSICSKTCFETPSSTARRVLTHERIETTESTAGPQSPFGSESSMKAGSTSRILDRASPKGTERRCSNQDTPRRLTGRGLA